jgi:hypothetical protein
MFPFAPQRPDEFACAVEQEGRVLAGFGHEKSSHGLTVEGERPDAVRACGLKSLMVAFQLGFQALVVRMVMVDD